MEKRILELINKKMKKFLKDSYHLHRDPVLLDQANKKKGINTSDPNSII